MSFYPVPIIKLVFQPKSMPVIEPAIMLLWFPIPSSFKYQNVSFLRPTKYKGDVII